MGLRNPSRLSIDPETDVPYSAWVGPDAGEPSATLGPSTYENAAQLDRAGNYGWPYCMGNKQAYRDRTAVPNPQGNGTPRTTNDGGYVSGGPATGGTDGWYDCDNIVNDSTNNTGLSGCSRTAPERAWTRARCGRRTSGTAAGTPAATAARTSRASAAPQNAPELRRDEHAAVPVRDRRRRDDHERPGLPVRRGRRVRRPAAGPSTGTGAGSCSTRAATASSTASCSTRRPTRTAASRSTPTACATSTTGTPRTWTRSSGPTARSTSRTTPGSSARTPTSASSGSTTPAGRRRRSRTRRAIPIGSNRVRFSSAGSGGITYEWDFGDGSATSDEANPDSPVSGGGRVHRHADGDVRRRRDVDSDGRGRGARGR